MKPYPKYKPSGIEWIGEMPEHWACPRLKWVARFNYGASLKNEERINSNIPVYGSNGIVGYHSIAIAKGPNIIIGRKGSFGKVNYSYTDCFPIDTTYFIDESVTEHNMRWLYYTLLLLKLDSISKDSAVPGLAREDAYEKTLPLPPYAEQTAIANYLDRKTAQIDDLIAKKQRLIELLNEEKTALINRAVTKGLNPDAPKKDSGIPYLGEIPAHWEVKKVKHVCKIQGRIGFKGYKSSDLVPQGEGALTLGASHISREHKLDLTEPVFLSWEKYYESPEIMVKKGDVVFTQRGVYLGKVALIDQDYGKVTINPSLILLKEISINGGYLTYFLTSKIIRLNVNLISSSTAIPMISQEQLSNFPCLSPPKGEQEKVFDFINNQIKRVDNTIKKIEAEIKFTQEYRTALISEAVTGKIDLRNEAI